MDTTVKIQLLTKAGAFVIEVEIPVFLVKPRVIVWNSRSFIYDFEDKVYYEDSSYTVHTK